MKPLVSIIVPVFNVEAYLERCLDSLLVQTMQNIEIIIIDDGSTDGSGDICDWYAAKDKRIKVIHTENEGLSAARNKGIDMSRADWIMFVDSDDWVEPDFCETPYRAAVKSGTEIVVFRWRRHRKGWLPRRREIDCPEGPITREQFIDILYRYDVMSAWCKLYDRRLFDHVRFPEGQTSEDIVVTCKLAETIERGCYIDKTLYNYTAGRPGSITSTWDNTILKDRAAAHILKKELFLRWKYDTTILDQAWALGTLIYYGTVERTMNDCIVDILNSIKGFPNSFTIRQKIMLGVWRMSPMLFDLICILTKKRLRNISQQ